MKAAVVAVAVLVALLTACGGRLEDDPAGGSEPSTGSCRTSQGPVTCDQQSFYVFVDQPGGDVLGGQCRNVTCPRGARCAALVVGGGLAYGVCE